jgi:hypothetical protein
VVQSQWLEDIMARSHHTSSLEHSTDDDFDAHSAAALLAGTRRSARRGFEQRTPLVCAALAVLLLAIYGTLWLSVRDQHPYVGPSGTVAAWVYGLVAVTAVVTLTAYRRATDGVRGPSRREQAIAALVVGVPWIAVYVFNAALQADGFGNSLVLGVFDAAGPWLVVGTGTAALAAGREQWGRMTVGMVAVGIATAAAFFGPAGCWAAIAVSAFVGFLALAVVQYVQLQRA